jgi:hypothetical protein
MSRFFLMSLILAVPLSARADDLSNIVERDKIAVQKLVSEVNDALATARAFEKDDAARAKASLEDALTKIASSTVVSDEQRTSLRQRVQARLTEISRQARVQEQANEDAAKRAADKAKKEQQTKPADGKSLTETARSKMLSTQDQIAAAKNLRDQRAKGNLGIFASLEAAATPIDGVVEYPKYWAQLTESRKNFTGNKLSAKEVTLLKALNSTLSVNFKEAQFKDVLEYIQEKSGVAIIVDEGSLKEAMVEYNDPVNFKIQKVTVRTILKKILLDRGLSYIIKEGTVQVVTVQKARETMTVRSYPIDDLVGIDNPRFGFLVNRAIMLQHVQMLIQNIQSAIDPTLWNTPGGGSITFNEANRTLVIRAPAELHYMLGGAGF